MFKFTAVLKLVMITTMIFFYCVETTKPPNPDETKEVPDNPNQLPGTEQNPENRDNPDTFAYNHRENLNEQLLSDTDQEKSDGVWFPPSSKQKSDKSESNLLDFSESDIHQNLLSNKGIEKSEYIFDKNPYSEPIFDLHENKKKYLDSDPKTKSLPVALKKNDETNHFEIQNSYLSQEIKDNNNNNLPEDNRHNLFYMPEDNNLYNNNNLRENHFHHHNNLPEDYYLNRNNFAEDEYYGYNNHKNNWLGDDLDIPNDIDQSLNKSSDERKKYDTEELYKKLEELEKNEAELNKLIEEKRENSSDLKKKGMSTEIKKDFENPKNVRKNRLKLIRIKFNKIMSEAIESCKELQKPFLSEDDFNHFSGLGKESLPQPDDRSYSSHENPIERIKNYLNEDSEKLMKTFLTSKNHNSNLFQELEEEIEKLFKKEDERVYFQNEKIYDSSSRLAHRVIIMDLKNSTFYEFRKLLREIQLNVSLRRSQNIFEIYDVALYCRDFKIDETTTIFVLTYAPRGPLLKNFFKEQNWKASNGLTGFGIDFEKRLQIGKFLFQNSSKVTSELVINQRDLDGLYVSEVKGPGVFKIIENGIEKAYTVKFPSLWDIEITDSFDIFSYLEVDSERKLGPPKPKKKSENQSYVQIYQSQLQTSQRSKISKFPKNKQQPAPKDRDEDQKSSVITEHSNIRQFSGMKRRKYNQSKVLNRPQKSSRYKRSKQNQDKLSSSYVDLYNKKKEFLKNKKSKKTRTFRKQNFKKKSGKVSQLSKIGSRRYGFKEKSYLEMSGLGNYKKDPSKIMEDIDEDSEKIKKQNFISKIIPEEQKIEDTKLKIPKIESPKSEENHLKITRPIIFGPDHNESEKVSLDGTKPLSLKIGDLEKNLSELDLSEKNIFKFETKDFMKTKNFKKVKINYYELNI